jgi:hypothetical protein
MTYFLETIVRMGEHDETAFIIRTGEAYWTDADPQFFKDKDCVYVKTITDRWLTEEEFELIKGIFDLEEHPMKAAVYERTQHYGGPEEGGWYYHTLERVGDIGCRPLEELDSYGEGFVEEWEVYENEHDQLSRPYYS